LNVGAACYSFIFKNPQYWIESQTISAANIVYFTEIELRATIVIHRHKTEKIKRANSFLRSRDLKMQQVFKVRSAVVAMILFCAAGGVRAAVLQEVLQGPTEQYRRYMIEEIGQTLAAAKTLHERVVAKDLDGAKQAWITARINWERAEVFTSGFVSDLDEEIDAWPNALTGFHAIEAKLFGAKNTDVAGETTQLIYRLVDLDIKVRQMPLNAQGLLNGTARLAFEVGESKANGGESRYSGTSLDDMRNNVFGIQLAYKVIFSAALEAADPKLAAKANETIQRLAALLEVRDVKTTEPDRIRAKSEELVVALQEAAPKIGLKTPTLEDITQ
jgi:iron uptake system component EfeO